MLQAVDNNAAQDRRQWMALLARAPEPLLAEGLQTVPPPAFTWLRRPETGLVMVRGRVGGTGNRFNLGEMTVTRCTLRLADGNSGVAYIQGRSHRRAELAALADALLQAENTRETVRRAVLEPVERHLAAIAGQMARKAQSTRVEFFTVAREAGAGDADGEDA